VGYTRTPKVYKLAFADDTDYPGLEVAVRGMSLGQLLQARASTDDSDAVADMVELLADRIVSWNLEDEQGRPVPTTREAMLTEDADMILDICSQWQQAIAGVSAPLVSDSSSGETSAVESIPTEALSGSLAS
jgi:hypothetical protein